MTFLGYLIYAFILFPLSLIPLPILYVMSSGMRFILFDAIGYRKLVIWNNLKNSFPDKTDSELKLIQSKFQRNFCDIFFAETIKGLSPFTFYLKRMMKVNNLELLEELYTKNRGVIISSGHFGNWELQAHLPYHEKFRHHLVGIYKVQSTIADLVMKISRGKSGADLVPMENVKRSFSTPAEKPKAYLFIGDQSPANPKSAHWMTFLNQETGVQFGTEKSAKVYDYAVVYLEIVRLQRGRYELNFSLVTDTPKSLPSGEITELQTRKLEESIRRQPDNWLWSHRRWKHKKPAEHA